jgi:hypothetical protein
VPYLSFDLSNNSGARIVVRASYGAPKSTLLSTYFADMIIAGAKFASPTKCQ